MSTLSFALRDSATMLRRDVRHSLRRLSMTLSGLLVPIIMLVLFVYVFGGAIGAGLGDGTYINYIAPGIILMTVGSGCATTVCRPCAAPLSIMRYRWFQAGSGASTSAPSG